MYSLARFSLTRINPTYVIIPRVVSADLFTVCAARGELVLVAGHAVVFILVRDEGL